jgi:pyrrolysine biosynthesis protein PylD
VTRLTTADIQTIADDLVDYDADLVAGTGHSLRGIACRAAGISEAQFDKTIGNLMVAVIPITSGEGLIGKFCDAVKSISCHLGANTFITQATDVAGLAEAFEKKTDIVLMSDDDRFIALHAQRCRLIDNADATGNGYVAGLNLMTGGLKNRDVLVVGCGPVGLGAVESLIRIGARVSVYDIDLSNSQNLAAKIKSAFDSDILIENDLETALSEHRLIVDASPATDIIKEHHIAPDTYISAPGVPLGLSDQAGLKISNRLLHDPLQIGVATMVACACNPKVA